MSFVAGFVCWLTLFDADFSSKGKTIYLFKYRQEKVCLYHPLPFMCDYRLFFARRFVLKSCTTTIGSSQAMSALSPCESLDFSPSSIRGSRARSIHSRDNASRLNSKRQSPFP